ncbi:ankyrin repeat and SOCS box containing 8 [Columba livia]|uniref:Ankyrin repeat and SOCS box containing 8 n=1 Tax=Columba livia TaxID=8932 RepID=A0A2I0LKA4_COLLI|nr:ankyrin repeat and SOCS box protein 8 [Columba livia]PKK17871.1 ankyrin repeat and SOCS box containing 8 [Columba livia]
MHGTLKPLHCACMVADTDCVELLLQKGAEVNALDGYNRTALHYAAEKDETCVEILLEYGADPNAPDGNKDTPLHWAAFKNNAECARSLLENGARVNARDYNADTPLSWAAMKGNLESVSVLLDFGAEVRVTNLKGQTPISRLVALLVRGLGTEREDSCFELLHRAAGQFELRKNGSMPWEVTRDPQLCQKLTLLCSAPGTLQTLSRYAVRRSLGVQFLPEAVEQLPLRNRDNLLLGREMKVLSDLQNPWGRVCRRERAMNLLKHLNSEFLRLKCCPRGSTQSTYPSPPQRSGNRFSV